MKYYLAIDLGASSGRHIVGHEENGQIILDEVHRFTTGMNDSQNGLIWNTDRLFYEIKQGIKLALLKYPRIESLAIDCWGVDYVLLNGDENIKPNYAYRNNRTSKIIDEVHNIISFDELYIKTGIQFAPYNTIYQLFDDFKQGRLDNATDFLMLPQYFAYLLTGLKKHEYTECSTTGLLNSKTREFDLDIVHKLGLPERLFKNVDMPGSEVGYLKQEIADEVGGQIKVVLAPSHDTACAFEAVDIPKDGVFLSSGTWSLLGYKLEKPNTNKEALEANFTNEGGVNHIRFIKNLMGMWIPNQIQKQSKWSYQKMIKWARQSSYSYYFDTNDSSLVAPKDMRLAILNLLKDNPPLTKEDFCRSIYLSLAYSYKKTINELEKCLNREIKAIYIVGGGAKNELLNELTEIITGRIVIAFPIEATAIGNIRMQILIRNN